jgi:hypothetical protein
MDSSISAGYEKAEFKIHAKRYSNNRFFLASGDFRCLSGLFKNQVPLSQLNIN